MCCQRDLIVVWKLFDVVGDLFKLLTMTTGFLALSLHSHHPQGITVSDNTLLHSTA